MEDFYNKVLHDHCMKAEEQYKKEEYLSYTIDFKEVEKEIFELIQVGCGSPADFATPWYKDELMKEIWNLDEYNSAGLRQEGDFVVFEEDCEPEIVAIQFTRRWDVGYKIFRHELSVTGLLLGLLVAMLTEGGNDDYYAKLQITNGCIDCWFTVYATYGS